MPRNKKITDFPKKGEDQEISLANSKYPQADYEYCLKIKKEYPSLWKKGGNIFGNTAFKLWGEYRKGNKSPKVLKWIKKREAWFARHYGDKNVPGIIAWLKWGGYGQHGESGVKKILAEEMKKIRARKKAGIEEYYEDYNVKDLNSLNEEVSFLYEKYLSDNVRKVILDLKKVYMGLLNEGNEELDPLRDRIKVFRATKYIFDMYRSDYREHKRLIDYCANLLCEVYFAHL